MEAIDAINGKIPDIILTTDTSSSSSGIFFDFSNIKQDPSCISDEGSDVNLVCDEEEQMIHADNIAKQMMDMLIAAFKSKEGRDPTVVECEEMFSELTEERIAALMNGQGEKCIDEEIEESDGSEDEENEEKEGDDEEVAVDDSASTKMEVKPNNDSDIVCDENLVGNKRNVDAANLVADLQGIV